MSAESLSADLRLMGIFGWSVLCARKGLEVLCPLHPPPLVVAHTGYFFEADDHHPAVRTEREELGFEQVRDRAGNSGSELGQGFHGHAWDVAIQPFVKHGVHPDDAYDGLTRIIVAAALSQVMGAQDGALERHDRKQICCTKKQYISP